MCNFVVFVNSSYKYGKKVKLHLNFKPNIFSEIIKLQENGAVYVHRLDRFTKTFFWNFQKNRAVLYYILINKQMLEKVFCSNMAPSLSSGNHLFYKAEYMGRVALIRFGP